MSGLAFQEIYHRRITKVSASQLGLFALFCIGGIALIAFAMSYHNGRISDRLLMIAMGVLANCIGPLLWWSGKQTNKEVIGRPELFHEGVATGGVWRRVSESKNSPRWFEVAMDGDEATPVIFYDRWQEGPFDLFEQQIAAGDVPMKMWYVEREADGGTVLMRAEVDL